MRCERFRSELDADAVEQLSRSELASELASGDGDPESPHIDHEAVAYINRMGQFYYFAESDYMKSYTTASQVTIATIRKYMIFRNKFTAHRSLDAPYRETEDEKIAHARAVTSMLGSLFTPIPNIEQNDYRTYDDPEKITRDIWSTNYRTYQTYDPSVGHVDFAIQIEHPTIMDECYEVIRRVLV